MVRFRAIQLNSAAREALSGLGRVYEAQGKDDDTLSNYDRAIQLNPYDEDTKILRDAFRQRKKQSHR
ncbi:hypothetical protein NUACC26_084830 [Scytonema sp. NUACC26]